jgi:hypothetical protein
MRRFQLEMSVSFADGVKNGRLVAQKRKQENRGFYPHPSPS